MLFHSVDSGNKHAATYEAVRTIDTFNFQCMRADQNLFDMIPAGSSFLMFAKSLRPFRSVAKNTYSHNQENLLRNSCARFFFYLCFLRGDQRRCAICHDLDVPVYRLLKRSHVG
jgi:hypothetical protein